MFVDLQFSTNTSKVMLIATDFGTKMKLTNFSFLSSFKLACIFLLGIAKVVTGLLQKGF